VNEDVDVGTSSSSEDFETWGKPGDSQQSAHRDEGKRALPAESLNDAAENASFSPEKRLESVYCNADNSFVLNMMELAVRTLTVPLFGINDESPTSVLLGSENSNAAFARSISSLEEIQQSHPSSSHRRTAGTEEKHEDEQLVFSPHRRSRQFLYRLEGKTTTSVTPILTRGFSDLMPGWYCLNVVDSADFCIVGSVPFVVGDRGPRKDSEFGVATFTLPDLYSSVRSVMAQVEAQKASQKFPRSVEGQAAKDANIREDAEETEAPTVWLPKHVVVGMPVPVVVRSPTIEAVTKNYRHERDTKERSILKDLSFLRYAMRSGGGPSDAVRSDATAPNTNDSTSALFDEFHAGALHVELVYGAGSFWIIPGAAYLQAFSNVAQGQPYAKKLHDLERSNFVKKAKGDPDIPVSALFDLLRGGYWLSRRAVLPYHDRDGRRGEESFIRDFLGSSASLRQLRTAPQGGIPLPEGGNNKKNNKKDKHTSQASVSSLLFSDCVPQDFFTYTVPDLVVPEWKKTHPKTMESRETHAQNLVLRRVNATVTVVAHKHVARVSDAVGFFEALHRGKTAFRNHAKKIGGRDDSEPICVIQIVNSISIGQTESIQGVECTVLLGEQVVVTVLQGARLRLSGTRHSPLVFTSPPCGAGAPAGCRWGGFVVQPNAELQLEWTMLTLAGSRGVRREPNTGSHIKDRAPAITAASGAVLALRRSAVLNCAGPALALGPNSKTVIDAVLIQDVAQGGECVSCTVDINSSHIVDVPYNNRNFGAFVDKDNDGFYFRGGTARMYKTVIAYALDDGVDSASSTGDSFESSLTILSSIVAGCQHEGIALSSSEGTTRRVVVTDSVVRRCQQGIENGHTSSTHVAILTDLQLEDNHVGVRHGDNYNLDTNGIVQIIDTTFKYNDINILSYSIREHVHWLRGHGSKRKGLPTDPKSVVAGIFNPLVGSIYTGPNMELVVKKKVDNLTQSKAAKIFVQNCSLGQPASSDDDREDHGYSHRQRRSSEGGRKKPVEHLSSMQSDQGVQCGEHHFLVTSQLLHAKSP
jgi:hypothetical protein